ncbi:MAG: hypothetical protein JMDDDDMK_00235 [Acidobacteria bacterium]|nr:hypothetical protein [Acidobacteriota bacterium]
MIWSVLRISVRRRRVRYTDSRNNTINYTFVAVDGGEELYFQATDPGAIISGVGSRVQ